MCTFLYFCAYRFAGVKIMKSNISLISDDLDKKKMKSYRCKQLSCYYDTDREKWHCIRQIMQPGKTYCRWQVLPRQKMAPQVLPRHQMQPSEATSSQRYITIYVYEKD